MDNDVIIKKAKISCSYDGRECTRDELEYYISIEEFINNYYIFAPSDVFSDCKEIEYHNLTNEEIEKARLEAILVYMCFNKSNFKLIFEKRLFIALNSR